LPDLHVEEGLKRSPLPAKRATPRRNEGRVQHGRIKRKATDMNSLEEAHVEGIRKMPCVVSGKSPVVAHHLMKAPGKRCRRDHRWVVPLIPDLHNMGDKSVHALGSEAEFEREHGLAPGFLIAWAKREWERTCELAD
jgi:hypothetical protein